MNFGDINLGSEEVSFANASKNECGDHKQEVSNYPVAEEVRHPPTTRAQLGVRPGSGTNYPSPPSADCYRPGSGTNYPVSPTTGGMGAPARSADNDHVVHWYRNLGIFSGD